MQPIWCNVAALAVALLFYVWRTHRHLLERRQRVLRQRVAYMLWVMADQADESFPPALPADCLTTAQS
jgi:hypothetical protein